MEDALALKKNVKNQAVENVVLILVLMEDALARAIPATYSSSLYVLILVLMEDALAQEP